MNKTVRLPIVMNILSKSKISFLVFAILLTGCASLDYQLTSFQPINTTEEQHIYAYKAFADAVYPHDSEEAEKIRMEWLGKWIKNNNLENYQYEIISRNPVIKQKGTFGTIYDIYYQVRFYK